MVTTLSAEQVEISIHDGVWELIPADETWLSRQPIFRVTRGSGVMEYTPGFGASHKMPGTVLSVEYVRAVVVGYEEKSQRWLLGFQIAGRASDKARWLELVRWPPGENLLYATSARHAGHELAEYIQCPLKIFGEKKIAQPVDTPGRSGVTGPLLPHRREDIGPQQVKLLAQSIGLPLEYPTIWLGHTRAGLTLRLSKEIIGDKSSRVTPSFNTCVIDSEHQRIRLQPPTGLLGTFFGGQPAREIRYEAVRNIELRHTTAQEYVPQKDENGEVIEAAILIHVWDIYLTLPDESLLLAQTTHTTSSELSRKRITVTDRFSVNTGAGIEYLRKHQADQKAYDAALKGAETVALVIASALGTHLTKTEVEEVGA